MTHRNTDFNWLELIAVQVAPSLAGELIARLGRIADAINLGPDVVAQVYTRPASAAEASLHLLHTTTCSGQPSPLGLRVALQLAELGATAHSVWEPRTQALLTKEGDQ